MSLTFYTPRTLRFQMAITKKKKKTVQHTVFELKSKKYIWYQLFNNKYSTGDYSRLSSPGAGGVVSYIFQGVCRTSN